MISTDPFFTTQSKQLGALALRNAMPAIYQYPPFAAAGGLMSYGGSITDNFRLVGVYTARILNGENASSSRCSAARRQHLSLSWLLTRAQQPAMPVVGFLNAD